MGTIVLILMLITAFNFLLKQTFWKRTATAVAAVAGYGCQLCALLVLRYEVGEHLGRYCPLLAQD